MYDFYLDEQADDEQRRLADGAIKALKHSVEEGWISADLGEAATADVREILKDRLAARWDTTR
jgi:hypothetical protein